MRCRRRGKGYDRALNFLLHRHFALVELAAPAAGVGAMLPDLWRMADRRVRPAADLAGGGDPRRRDADGVLAELLAGVRHHVEADRWFHRTAVFVEGERSTAARLRGAGLDAPRMPLFAHVTWEMCLDGALLAREGTGATLRALREAFALTAGPPEDGAAHLHHWGRRERPAEDRAAFDRRMDRLREEIARGPWIEGYQDAEGVAIRLAGIRARLGLDPLSTADHRRLGEALAPVLDDAHAALRALEIDRERIRQRDGKEPPASIE